MSGEKKYVQTPLMQQYYAIKAVHGDAILLFRVGDFYETFGEDAIKASGILGITLTRRANGAASFVELAGFPYHSLDTYLPKLVRAGERVAVCEQLEDPKTVKGIVKRGVVELITPGTALGDNILEKKENSFLASVFFGPRETGVAFMDISTGEFYATEGSDAFVDKLLSNFAPKEVLYQRSCEGRFRAAFGNNYYTYRLEDWIYNEDTAREKVCRQMGTRNLKGFGIEEMGAAVSAAGSVLYYMEFTEHRDLSHVSGISRIESGDHVWIDRFTARNLELFGGGERGRHSLADTLDRTATAMGARLLRRRIAMPEKDLGEIGRRLDTVGAFLADGETLGETADLLKLVSDLERISSRIATRRVYPRELVQLKNSLDALGELKEMLAACGQENLAAFAAQLDTADEVRQKIAADIFPDPSNNIAKGGVISDAASLELADLRNIAARGKDLLGEIQKRESEATGIPLKISFNNVFGYYIEVRNTHNDKVPQGWIRKQTLTSAERYITPELKEYEEKILGAEEKILALEVDIYTRLMEYLAGFLGRLQRTAALVADLDVLHSFAVTASERNYNRPEIDTSHDIDIRDGRHPVVETLLPVGETYIPNDVFLDNERQQVMLITGPNMSGKSALLRQTALIVLMAQIGSYVPAASARIGIVDKIFTRVGASDNISQGESTFMVEMIESAGILNNVSERSLLLLDEIGRGTSTYDGISIAWSMVEYIHSHRTRPKTMFATHYHELNELESICERVRNYNVSVKELERNIVFLRKLVPGGTEHSFGIHVARMAGMPKKVVERAETILAQLESQRAGDSENIQQTNKKVRAKKLPHDASPAFQLSMFQLDDPVLVSIRDQIKGLDIDSLTPLEALNRLHEIKKLSGL